MGEECTVRTEILTRFIPVLDKIVLHTAIDTFTYKDHLRHTSGMHTDELKGIECR